MKISVIIPTYKPGYYIWECLNSLCIQTLQKDLFEVLLVLNGCDEPYYSQINHYINEHRETNIKFLFAQTKGVSNARNIALDVAQGEYVTFIDDDDYISETYLEELLKISSPNIIGIARPTAFTEGINDSQPYQISDVFDKNYPADKITFLKLRRYFSGPCMKLIYRDIIGNRRFNVNYTIGEDGLFMFSISDKIKLCSLASPSAIYYRRYRSGSLTISGKTIMFRIKNKLGLIWEMMKIFFSHPFNYNLKFYCIQSLSCIKGLFR